MAQTAPARVDLPGGPVTLEPLDRLTAEAGRLSAEAQAELERSNAAIAAAQDKLAQAGTLLTDHPDGWDHGAVAAEGGGLDAAEGPGRGSSR